jgi:hypothetical protein
VARLTALDRAAATEVIGALGERAADAVLARRDEILQIARSAAPTTGE